MKLLLKNLVPRIGRLKACAIVLLCIVACFGIFLTGGAAKRLIQAKLTSNWIPHTAHFTGNRLGDDTYIYPAATHNGHSTYSAPVPGKPLISFTYEGIEQTQGLAPPLFSKPIGEIQIACDPTESYRVRLDGSSLRTDLVRSFSTGGLIIVVSLFLLNKILKGSTLSLYELDK